MKYVIYAEKPSVGRKIAEALTEKKVEKKDGYLVITLWGEEAAVTWGFGHLCQLKNAKEYNEDYKNWHELPVPFIPNPYELTAKNDVKAQLKIIKKLLSEADAVINATDFDREGELIFYYLMTYLRCKKPFIRAHFSSLTELSIKDAFAHLVDSKDVKNITDAGRARSIADWLVGANMTAQMTLAVGGKDILSIGRVQTPTLKILVDREKDIAAFAKKKFYTVEGKFKTSGGDYTGNIERRFEDRAEADKIRELCVKNKTGVVTDVKKSTKTFPVPLLHNLSTLQMAANGAYGYTLADTLATAQELYESGYITYPRTDSQYLTKDMKGVVRDVLETLDKNPDFSSLINYKRAVNNESRVFNDSMVSSHYAIIPTTKKPSSLSLKQTNIYNLIARSLIAHLYPSATKEYLNVVTTVGKERFLSQGTTIIIEGWLEVIPGKKENALPPLSVGDKYDGEYKVAEKETEPPKRFTDKTIVAAMIGAGKELEDTELKEVFRSLGVHGIGTEATRASIIETLIKRGYVVRNKKTLIPTEKGISLIDCLPIEEVKSPALTAVWESKLDDIAKGVLSYDTFISEIEEQVTKWCRTLSSVTISSFSATSTKIAVSSSSKSPEKEKDIVLCPKCGEPLNRVSKISLYECNTADCGFKLWTKICGKELPITAVKALVTKGKTSEIAGFTSKAGKKFSASLELIDYKIKFVF